MIGKVLLFVLCGFGLLSLDNFIIRSCNPYLLESILYTLLVVTGAIHSKLVRCLFRRCCRPSFTKTSPLRLRAKAFSNRKNLERRLIGWPKRLLIFSAVMLHNSAASELSATALSRQCIFTVSRIAYSVSPCSHYNIRSHEPLHFCEFSPVSRVSTFAHRAYTHRMLQKEVIAEITIY